MTVMNILIVGVGGQGVLTASEILAQAALHLGLDVKKSEVAGMAQRGGVVTSHLRVGERVLSPQIDPGNADLILAFEIAEALRWLPWSRPEATLVVNSGRIVPPVVELGLYRYPSDAHEQLVASGRRVLILDAATEAQALGDIRLGNVLMLGAASPFLPFTPERLLQAIEARFARKGEAVVAKNRAAFARGQAIAAEGTPTPAATASH
ncbi:indolepyruvate oxidoreductase subunit beta [Hydrogenophilus islandicus]